MTESSLNDNCSTISLLIDIEDGSLGFSLTPISEHETVGFKGWYFLTNNF